MMPQPPGATRKPVNLGIHRSGMDPKMTKCKEVCGNFRSLPGRRPDGWRQNQAGAWNPHHAGNFRDLPGAGVVTKFAQG